MANGGRRVGVLPDGRELRVYKLQYKQDADVSVHYVYVCGDVVSITQPRGKTTDTIVIIDGVKYIPGVAEKPEPEK